MCAQRPEYGFTRMGAAAIVVGLAMSLLVVSTWAAVIVTPTMDSTNLKNALNPTGLTITSVSTLYGTTGQYGTYTNYIGEPITIGDGVVLSSGDVSFVVPPADPSLESPQPSYDMETPGTAEFDAYGPGHIENFNSSNDAAVLRVDFSLDDTYQIQFDFVFGSVEYPFYTSSFTDSFLVFLDGTGHTDQITSDLNGKPVQVGSSFAGLVSTSDQNTAFANPHGVLGLTTTTAEIDSGDHTLYFEIADVNDHVLDSAVFISHLRTGVGPEGTEPTDPEDYAPEPGDYNLNGIVDAADYVVWRKNNNTAITLPNDLTPGTVTQADYDVWRAHFGQLAGNGSGAFANAALPEPTTAVLLLFAAAGWCLCRGRAA